jgi:hypothetical protein
MTHHAERLVNPKVRAKNFWLLILDTPEHVDSEKLNRGYPKSVTKNFCTNFWVIKSLSMMCELHN